MPTIYTKTALKKIKKDELIQMFLDQQSKLNDIQMDDDGDWNAVLKLKEENEKLKEAYEDQHKYSCEIGDYIDKKQEQIEKLKEENEKLKVLEEEIEKLKENVMDEYGD